MWAGVCSLLGGLRKILQAALSRKSYPCMSPCPSSVRAHIWQRHRMLLLDNGLPVPGGAGWKIMWDLSQISGAGLCHRVDFVCPHPCFSFLRLTKLPCTQNVAIFRRDVPNRKQSRAWVKLDWESVTGFKLDGWCWGEESAQGWGSTQKYFYSSFIKFKFKPNKKPCSFSFYSPFSFLSPPIWIKLSLDCSIFCILKVFSCCLISL